MKTVRLTMAQALVRFLENQYVQIDDDVQRFVKGFFMLPGHGNVVGLGQALEQERKDMELYQGKNEQGMTHAANAFAKQKKRRQIFVCTSSIGPGAANMVTAAATATANQIPVLLLPGDIYASRQPDPVLQQVEHPQDLSITTNDAFKAVCKYWDRINRPEQIMTAMINAMRVLLDPADTGAVCICLPQDVQGESYDYPVSFFKKRIHRLERRPAPDYSIKEAADIIMNKKKPILICGGGVRYSDAAKAFADFAEKFNIPFGETQAGKSALVWDHPLNLGGIGVTGSKAANDIAKEADLVIGVGTRFTDFTTASKWLFQNENVEFIQINVSEFHASKLEAFKIIADARVGLQSLNEELENRNYKSSYSDEIGNAIDDWKRELHRLDNALYSEDFVPEVDDANRGSIEKYIEDIGSCLTQTQVLGMVNDIIDEDAVVVGSSGSLPGCMQRMWRSKKPDTYNMEYGYSCMGYEICGALGVKLAEPDKEVYAMTGDGSFVMLHSELITSIQDGIKINVVLFDNAEFGCINNLQVSQGNETMVTELRYRTQTGKHDGKYMNIDYAGIAAAYGCKTYRVTTMEQLKEALEDSKKQEVSTLIDIKVLPKTMTNGYGAWWRVGVAEVSSKAAVREAREELESNLKKAFKY